MLRRTFLILFAIFFAVLPLAASAKNANDPYAFQSAYELIGAYRAWDTTTGSSDVVVAVIDNGFDMLHPDLIDNVWKNVGEIAGNGIDDDGNGYIDDVWGWNFLPVDVNRDGQFSDAELQGNNDPRPDVDGLSDQEKHEGTFHHGTVVAGIIGARGNNELDGSGLNWRVRLMNVKVLGNNGVGTIVPLARAIRYAVDNGAHVINISMVGPESISEVAEAVAYAQQKGVVVVAAAGNTSTFLNQTKFYPICTDAGLNTQSVLGVSAVTPDRRITNFSNTGSACIDVAAPGLNIASTIRFSPTNGLVDRYGTGYSGTSFAAPMVAGAAALIKSVQPTWHATEIMQSILSTVQHTPGQDETIYANLFGAGLLQIDKAVQYAANQDSTASQPAQSPAPQPAPIAQAETFPVWQRISLGNTQTGVHTTLPSATEQAQAKQIVQLKGAYDAVAFTFDGKGYVAVAAQNKKKKVEVTVYTDTWEKVHAFATAYTKPVSLAVGDLDDKYKPEIIVAPQTRSKTLYSVYSYEGKLLSSQTVKHFHTGVSVLVTDAREVYVSYKDKKGFIVSQVTGKSEKKVADLPWVKSLPALAFGDLDANGTKEIVVGGGKGQEPVVVFYTAAGEEVRRFWAYDPSYRGGIDMALIDMDGNGHLELVVVPVAGSGAPKVLNNQVRTVVEWPEMAKLGSGELKLLIQSAPLTNQ